MYFGTISASDMLEIRQFILGNTTNFKNNASWRFVNAAHQFNRESPLNNIFEEVANIPLLANGIIINFTAIKTGNAMLFQMQIFQMNLK